MACAFEATASAQPVLYGVGTSFGGEPYLYRIDPTTAAAARFSNPIGFDNVHSMDFDPIGGVMYATAARSVAPGELQYVLLTIDLGSGQGTEVMSWSVGAGSVTSKVAVRASDGAIFVGYAGSGFARAIPPDLNTQPGPHSETFDFDSVGRLWWIYSEGNIFWGDPETGERNPPSYDVFVCCGVRVTSLSFKPGTDELFVVGDDGLSDVRRILYTLDRDTGGLTRIGAFSPPGGCACDLPMTALAWSADLNTPAGDPTVSLGRATLMFNDVTQPGTTTLTISTTGPPPPAGFKLGDSPMYYDLSTTAIFAEVTVCIDYSDVSYEGSGDQLVLAHFEPPSWVDRTVSRDPDNEVICARVTSLSPFAIFEPDSVADTTPPTLAVPDSLSVDATSPSGAAVTFDASATDDSGVATVQCLPASGSTFAIGTTTVSCTATDPSGNVAAATFTVTVRGAAEQIVAMLERLQHMPLDPAIRASLIAALNQCLSHPGSVLRTCARLRVFTSIVRRSAGRTTPPELAAQLIADATRIRAVLGCR
jgi:hypothetical protein